MSKTINLGPVTAYADAVDLAGYTGTRQEFAQDLANAANYAAESHQSAETASAAAETASTAAETATTAAASASDDATTAHADAEAALSFKESAETAAGTANTKAGEAANSASQAATSASGAAGSATAASGSATAAAGSATNAAASETAAAGSATSAAGSASAAAQTLADVNTAGATQVAAIAAKGAEVLESIPADYTTLSNDVDDLKSDLGDLDELETADKSSIVAAINEVSTPGGSRLTPELKSALLQLASKVAYIDAGGQTYYDDLYDALYNNTWSISNTLIGCISSNNNDEVLKNNSYSATISAIGGYTIAGAIVSVIMGGADITGSAYNNGVIYIGSVTGNLQISVNAIALPASSISAVYTQRGTVYNTDALDSLKPDLVVTATYADSSTAIIDSANYVLSGTLAEGSSTITVAYENVSSTFAVVVTLGFSYTPANGLLSAQNYISTENIDAITETITSDGLRIYSPVNTSEPRAVFSMPTMFNNYLKLKLEIKPVNVVAVSNTNKTNPGSPYLRFSNGTDNARYGFATSSGAGRLRYFSSGTDAILVACALNDWHTLEVTIENNTQTIKLDDVVILSNGAIQVETAETTGEAMLAVSTTKNGQIDVYIRKLEVAFSQA